MKTASTRASKQNDYVGWISRAKHEETRQKRLTQMLGELVGGTRYMNMPWRPASAARRRSIAG